MSPVPSHLNPLMHPENSQPTPEETPFLDGEPDVESMKFQSELQALTKLRRAIAVGDWAKFEDEASMTVAYFEHERAAKIINILMDNFLTEPQQGLLKQFVDRSYYV